MKNQTSSVLAVGLLLVAAACGGGPAEPARDQVGLHATLGANVTDTAGAILRQALVMRLGDAQGRPVAGAVLRFESLRTISPAGFAYSSAQFMPLDRLQYVSFLADTTDANGEASVLVSLGPVSGPAGVIVSVPTLGLVDTVAYTVTPGAPARISWVVKDTAVVAGGRVALKASVTDRNGNARTEAPSYTANQFIASVDASGMVTAGSVFGRGVVRAAYGSFRDSASVAVVSAGRLVVLRNGEVGLVNTDGSGYTRVTADPAANYPAVNRAGTQVAYHAYMPNGLQQILVVDVATGTRRVLLDPAVIISAVHPRFSADGSYIYFAARRTLDVQPSIWRAHPDGTGVEEVAAPGTESYSYPDPSPDGNELAFTDLYTGHVVVRTLATGAMRPTSLLGKYPRYSPDGGMLAAVSSTLNVVGADGTGGRSFTNPALYLEGGLTWCPSGACLVSRSYNGLTMTVLMSGESLDMVVNRDKYQVSF